VNNKTAAANLWSKINSIDWKLLIFLLLFLDVKLWVKIAAIILIFALRFDLKFEFRLKGSRLPLFYPLVIAIGIFNWLISGYITNFNYDLVVLSGILFWGLCILAIHQVKLSVEKNDVETIHRTILVFFILNAIVSLTVYAGIIIETGHINPYRYQGNYQKYFIGTGDYIKGITLDTSTTNAVLNAFGVIYYLGRKKYVMVLLCMAVLLLTGSNISNLFLCGIMTFMFIFQSSKEQKSIMIVCLVMLVIFMARISPQNNIYVATAWKKLFNEKYERNYLTPRVVPIIERPDSTLNSDEKKQKIAQLYLDSLSQLSIKKDNPVAAVKETAVKPVIKFAEKPVIPKDSIHTPTFQHKNDTTVVEKKLLEFIAEEPNEALIAAKKREKLKFPGKIIAMQQTFHYFKAHPWKLFTGTGIGNFSSKLAFRVTGMSVGGGYPSKYSYINEDFERNHFDLYLYYFTSKDGLHSLIHNPNSTYDQLLSEYGCCRSSFFISVFL